MSASPPVTLCHPDRGVPVLSDAMCGIRRGRFAHRTPGLPERARTKDPLHRKGEGMISFTLRGIVREAETGIGISGVIVKAYDADLLFDDLLGSDRTDAAGRFDIVSQATDFRELFETKPDLYFRVLSADGARELHRTATATNWSATPAEIQIDVPRSELGESAPKRAFTLFGGPSEEPRERFSPGEPLAVAASGLRPASPYDVVVRDERGNELFTDRLITDASGRIEPTVVWAQIGLDDPGGGPPLTVEDAQQRWDGRSITLDLTDGDEVVGTSTAQISADRSRPLVVATNLDGVAVNGFEVGEQDAVVSIYGLPAEEIDGVRVLMVPRQHDWRVGDPLRPVELERGRQAATDVELAAERDIRVRIAEAAELRPGSYDFILRPLRYGFENDQPVLTPSDIVGSRWITGLVVREGFMASKAVRGGCVNALQIAGRSVNGAPYLQFTDVFQVGENVYGALDPAALDPNHTSKMVAFYVVQHKSAAQWTADSSLQHLAVLGGNPAVQKLLTQSFCVNANKRLLWPNATAVGEYDVVADFGNNAPDPATFVSDASFDTPLDLIDGYFVPGFRIVPDPGTDTQYANVGSFPYDETTQGTITVTDDFGGSWTVNARAVVYFPADIAGATTPSQISAALASYPLVVVAHGNSSYTNSYTGYNYLLEHLARNGFIAASIHLNPGMYAIDRARVLLHHIDVVKSLFGSKAANNVGLMGHSRGGEAVIVAARLNQQQGLGHTINALVSLAPTDWISSPTLGGPWATPYLVIYGSMDGDVSGIEDTGFELYDRASDRSKSMVFVYGSTHGRYNTVWGDVDVAWLGSTDIPKLVNADAHRAIARSYMTAFYRQQLRAESQWSGLLKGEWIPASVQQADPGKVKLYVQYEDTVRRQVDTFEGTHSATSWQTSTLGGAVSQSGLPASPQEAQLRDIDAHSPHETGGLALAWDTAGDTLRFDVPPGQRDVTAYAAVSFRITQKVDSPSNPTGQPQDLRVTLRDTGGNTRAVRVSKFGEVPPPHARHYNSLTKSALGTIRIPLTAYTIKCAGVQEVNLSDVESVTFEFSEVAAGEVEIDSVEFTE